MSNLFLGGKEGDVSHLKWTSLKRVKENVKIVEDNTFKRHPRKWYYNKNPYRIWLEKQHVQLPKLPC